ncbi:hypothetical protein MAJHIDBO_00802 [Propionibacterium freudenreichii subsp. shermanii]|nr:hypothetical protein MAJHIDBO_00802 [Propionibacterium freudenreichii subsp. shermanii]SPS08606.1 hypothetical protein MAJHIDBO_00802 [Propionibacterium freudenreichii subsp. shermanii]
MVCVAEVSPVYTTLPLASLTSFTTWVVLRWPSLARVAKPVALSIGLTCPVPRAMRLLRSQPSPVGTPASLAALTVSAGPLGMRCSRSVNAVFIE